MAIKKITLTEDHLKLISAIKFEEFRFDEKEEFTKIKKQVMSLKLDESTKDIKSQNDFIINEIATINPNSRFGWGIDQYNLFGGTFVLEDVALITGHYYDYIEGTEFEPTGKRYPKELEEYMYGLYEYIYENLYFIESLVHFYCIKGGLTPGTYKCKDNELFWEKVEEKKKDE